MTAPDTPDVLAAHILAAAPRCGSSRLVCVDGPAGSGKTTLAARLSAALGAAPVVHLDDLYEGWDQQLGEPLARRVEAWLLLAWSSGMGGRHLRYDWVAGRFVEWVEVPAAPVLILEGCASGSRLIRSRATALIWVEAPADERLRRGLERDRPALEHEWRRWQEHEAAHFAADGTRSAASFVVDGVTGLAQPGPAARMT